MVVEVGSSQHVGAVEVSIIPVGGGINEHHSSMLHAAQHKPHVTGLSMKPATSRGLGC